MHKLLCTALICTLIFTSIVFAAHRAPKHVTMRIVVHNNTSYRLTEVESGLRTRFTYLQPHTTHTFIYNSRHNSRREKSGLKLMHLYASSPSQGKNDFCYVEVNFAQHKILVTNSVNNVNKLRYFSCKLENKEVVVYPDVG